ncbi:MAG TPA: DNA internalization-related competence protein ComEC/Rec2 [Dehalococcoidales bacterium]|nr:MAG: DNA internalization-related competence protein ComEC/Rec2 [Chloroflexi bacterium RBG_16_60_22]HJX13832.1 DNA internalization-related competence protein ComEC/Rec2 [Dehalococcoidales bacterium]
MLLVFLSCVWVVGVLLGSKFHLPPALALVGLVPLLLLFFTRTRRRPLVLAALGIFIIVGAAAYSFASLNAVDAARLRYYNDTGTMVIRGTVSADPDVRDNGTRLTLSAARIFVDGDWREVRGKALVFVPRYPAHEYGDVLRLEGAPETPAPVDDFDYRGYLAHQGIYTVMFYPKIEVRETGRGFPPLAALYSLRGELAEKLAEVLPEPQASLAQGVVLGIRANVPPELREAFSRSGAAHLLAISGLHLGIMAGVVLGLGLWLFGRRRYLYVWLALAAVWLYALITGLHPPVVRGAIMATMFLLAERLGRQRSAIVALTFAAAVMVGLSPYILGDASFQLSFLAMAGLVFIFPILRERGRRAVAATLGEEGALAATGNVIVDTLSATLGAVIAVWPVVAYYFGIVSLVGPLTTFLALPALPGIIIAGALAAVLGLGVLAVGQVVGWLAWVFLSYLLVVVGGLAAPSVSSVAVDSVSPAFVWGYYVIFAAAIWFYRRRSRRRSPAAGASGSLSFAPAQIGKLVIVPLLAAAVLVTFTASSMPDGNLRVSFLDVGEGDAVLVQQGSRQVLIDGGPSPQAVTRALGRRMPFWDRTIDLVVLTHPHQDHLAGLVEVLRRYRVARVLAPDFPHDSPLYDEWQRTVAEKGIESTPARAGQRITLGNGVAIEVLNPSLPPLEGSQSDVDNNAVVLRVSHGDVSFLLTSDIMGEGEREMVRRRAGLAATVLKVAHHGSDTSTTPGFLAVADPRVAVISVGADNRFGHPDDGVVERLAGKLGKESIYRTDEHGTIDFTTDGERLRVAAGR